MTQHCIVCDSSGPFGKNYIKDVFANNNSCPSGRLLLATLSEIIDNELEEGNVHSKIMCKDCHKICVNYDMFKTNMNNLKSQLSGMFYSTQEKATVCDMATIKPIIEETTPKKTKGKFVVPASKLQPLPADYQLNLGKIAAMTKPRILSSQPLLNLKMTIGNSVLTQCLTTSTVKMLKPSELSNEQNTINIGDWNVNSMPSEMYSNRDENENEAENQEMEIDEEDNAIPESDDDPILIDASTIKTENDDGIQYLNSENFQLLLDGQVDDDEQTIVVDSNNSILQMISGQKLVYENGQLSLVMDENDDDDDGEQDSNDEESQIELQVSGDEETANAIIAAAQEQGGAFIKVESGEMYRVKSVQSKPSEPPVSGVSAVSGTSAVSGSSAISGSSVDTAAQLVAKDDDQYRCLVCENQRGPIKVSYTGDATNMVKHMKTQHSAKVYICALCGIIMRNRSEYATHTAEHTKKLPQSMKARTYDCEVCKKSYTSRTLLQEHMNLHTGNRPYACHVCEKTFASKYTMQAHLKTHQNRPRPFKCTCGKSFLSQQNLTQHEKTHLGIKSFVCNVCDKAFGTQHSLEVHGVVHSGQKTHVCDTCEKAFARRAELADHIRIHTGERPFECEVCGAKFSQRSNLHSHRRATHFDDRRHSCPDCPKRFKRRRLLQYHIKAVHTGERPLECAVCNSTFVYPEHYKKHLQIHNGERPYYCEICGKAFNSRDNRNAHRFVHSDKKPYECLACGASYMRKRMLVAHMNANGHLAESIVVNQPRVTKVTENLFTGKQSDAEDEPDDVKEEKQAEVQEEANVYTLSADGGISETSEVPMAAIDADTLEPQITDENGSVLRFIKVKMADGNSGWVALND